MVSDGRILKGGEFMEAVLKEAEEREAEALRLKDKRIEFKEWGRSCPSFRSNYSMYQQGYNQERDKSCRGNDLR